VCHHYSWTWHHAWDEITFLQLLLAVEEMQSQLRAENGIKEIIVGYFGEKDDLIAISDSKEVADLMSSLDDNAMMVRPEDLPPEVREIYLAEMHRLETGELRPASDFQTRDVIEENV
jgi:hypothetical protein